jgi:hypothetical protein
MKKVLLLALLLLATCVYSCVIGYETLFYINNEEVIKINPDGSGAYTMKLDLHEMLVQMAEALTEQPSQMADLLRMDSTISFNNSLSLSRTLADVESSMFKDGNLFIDFSLAEKKGVIVINLFYKNHDQLNFDRKHIWDFIGNNVQFGVSLPFISRGMDVSEISNQKSLSYTVIKNPDKTSSPAALTNPILMSFTLNFSKARIENKVDTLIWNQKLNNYKSLQQLRDDSAFSNHVFYRTTFIVSSEIKSHKGNVENLSFDKKTITYKNSLRDILDSPRRLEYSLEY